MPGLGSWVCELGIGRTGGEIQTGHQPPRSRRGQPVEAPQLCLAPWNLPSRSAAAIRTTRPSLPRSACTYTVSEIRSIYYGWATARASSIKSTQKVNGPAPQDGSTTANPTRRASILRLDADLLNIWPFPPSKAGKAGPIVAH